MANEFIEPLIRAIEISYFDFALIRDELYDWSAEPLDEWNQPVAYEDRAQGTYLLFENRLTPKGFVFMLGYTGGSMDLDGEP